MSWHADIAQAGLATDAGGTKEPSKLNSTGNEGQEHSPAAGETEEAGWGNEDGMF